MIIAILIGILFLDFIFLPSFFRFYDSSLSSLFLISVILYYGINKNTVLFVFLSALLIELLAGYNPGLYSIAFLLCVLILFILSKTFNIPTVSQASSIFTYAGLSIMG